jgi:hypothetical protein
LSEPRYPIYIPSKGRWQPARALTARCLIEDGVPFRLVVEPQEADAYSAAFGEDRVLVLPQDDMRLIGSRNWIKEHAAEHARHWQLDDNMRDFRRSFKGKRIRCPAGYALSVVEDFTDRYENVGLSGLNYTMFGFPELPPFQVNCHVYSCTLVNNAIPHRWRLLYNDDTDLCLQVLADGWCTLLVNAVQVNKMRTMTVGGGNTADLYGGDGRLRMAQALADQWPGIASVRWRYGRPQHHVPWGTFGPALRVKESPAPITYHDVKLAAAGEVKSERLRRLLDADAGIR